MTALRRFSVLLCAALLAVVGPARAQSPVPMAISAADVPGIARAALRAAVGDAPHGELLIDTMYLRLTSRDGSRSYPALSLHQLDVGLRVLGSDRDAAFRCPSDAPRPYLAPLCEPRTSQRFVRLFYLDVIDQATVTIWVSVIKPRRGPPMPFGPQFLDAFTAQYRVTRDARGWSSATLVTQVAS